MELRADHTEICEESRLILIEQLVKISDVLSNLPKKQVNAFVMAQFEGIKHVDIAITLNVSLRTVKYYIANTLAELTVIVSE